MYKYKVEVYRVVDGDTFYGIVDLGFKIHCDMKFRLLGIDTPETFRPKSEEERAHGKLATARVKELLEKRIITVSTQKTGKYGRWLATVTLDDGSDLTETLINEGFSKKASYETLTD